MSGTWRERREQLPWWKVMCCEMLDAVGINPDYAGTVEIRFSLTGPPVVNVHQAVVVSPETGEAISRIWQRYAMEAHEQTDAGKEGD